MSVLLSLMLLLQPNWDTDPDSWGIGSLQFKQGVETHNDNYLLPYDQKLPYFDAPNGDFASYLMLQINTDEYYQQLSLFPSLRNAKT